MAYEGMPQTQRLLGHLEALRKKFSWRTGAGAPFGPFFLVLGPPESEDDSLPGGGSDALEVLLENEKFVRKMGPSFCEQFEEFSTELLARFHENERLLAEVSEKMRTDNGSFS